MKLDQTALLGVNTINKGAELLMLAVRAQFISRGFAAPNLPFFFFSAKEAEHLGASRVFFGHGRRFGSVPFPQKEATAFYDQMPSFFQNKSIVKISDHDLILDASGFAYGKQWGLKPTENAAWHYERLRSKKSKIVLLPQAFGPFDQPDLANASRRLFDCCDQIWARDRESYSFVKNVAPDAPLRLCPDITFALRITPDLLAERASKRRIAVVPNGRMIDKTSLGGSYVQQLVLLIKGILADDYLVDIISHESKDEKLCRQIFEAVGNEHCHLRLNGTAIEIKKWLGGYDLVIASRFHALVSSLSHGTPCICFGWSHKYEELMNDFGLKKYVWEVDLPIEKKLRGINEILHSSSVEKTRAQLVAVARSNEKQVLTMWDSVFDLFSDDKNVIAA